MGTTMSEILVDSHVHGRVSKRVTVSHNTGDGIDCYTVLTYVNGETPSTSYAQHDNLIYALLDFRDRITGLNKELMETEDAR